MGSDPTERDGPARALAEDPTETDDRAASERPTTGTPWTQVLQSWKDDAPYAGLRPRTLANYERMLRSTFRWISKEHLEEVAYADLTAYRGDWQETHEDRWNRPLSKGTVNNWVSAVRSLYRHAVEKLELDVKDLGRKLDRFRKEDLERERAAYRPIPRDVFREILREARLQEDYLWAVAAHFKWATCGRIGDLFHLRWEDVDFQRGQVRIRKPKRGSPLEKPLYEGLLDDLRALRKRHRAHLGAAGWKDEDLRGDAGDPVFRREDPSRKNPRASFRQWFAYHLEKHAKAVGFEGKVHPHLVRASAATDLSERGVPLRDIMAQGGWESMGSLRLYLREDPEARRERMRASLDLERDP